ncbi:MAG TPA: VWA domain-containing protein [Pseudonocardia sp.]|nr:VWA domain-containing protein [Pseudonocardia sp.]
MTFTVEVDQNSYLPAGVGRVDAIITVRAPDTPVAAPPADALEIIILDCSTSMSGDRISAARRAAAEAIAQVRDGVAFAVIAGTATAEQVYPATGTATASARTRAEATAEVQRLRANGATAIGTWLALAGQIADRHGVDRPGGVRHAILLTDGQNGERVAVFQSALDAVVGRFTCDCRGVGTDWRVDELRAIASALLGTVDIVADPAELAADFRAIMAAAMGKTLADLALRLWTPRTARVKFVKQVAPTIEDLTARRTESGNLRGDYPLGSWGAESRDYHVCVELVPGVVGEPALAAARVSVVRGDEVLGRGDVLAQWTDDPALSTRISRGVALYTGQAELAGAIQEGIAAQERGDLRTATARLGRAVELAQAVKEATGNDATARLLAEVVDVDPATGTARLRAEASKAARMTLDSRSTVTVRVRG